MLKYLNLLIILLTILVVGSACGIGDQELNDPVYNFDYNKFKIKKMMIITVHEFQSSLNEFIQWKRNRGFSVKILIVSDNDSVDEIKEKIQDEYDDFGLSHIIIVGDIEHVPSPEFSGEPSDPSYTLLEGNDFIGDALISRISIKNNIELLNQLNKFIWYEKGFFIKKDWISRAIVAGTQHFDGITFTSHIAEIMRSQNSYFNNIFLILETDEDPGKMVIDSIENQGANMLVINSHGGPAGFESIPFMIEHLPLIHTFNGSFPFIHGAACSTGTFDWDRGDCFAEAILKYGTVENPAGPIGMLGFSCSTDSGPAMTAQEEAFEHLYYLDEIESLGELTYFSILYAMSQWDNTLAEQCFRHWHLFGDCSLVIWKKVPSYNTFY